MQYNSGMQKALSQQIAANTSAATTHRTQPGNNQTKLFHSIHSITLQIQA